MFPEPWTVGGVIFHQNNENKRFIAFSSISIEKPKSVFEEIVTLTTSLIFVCNFDFSVVPLLGVQTLVSLSSVFLGTPCASADNCISLGLEGSQPLYLMHSSRFLFGLNKHVLGFFTHCLLILTCLSQTFCNFPCYSLGLMKGRFSFS